MWATTSGCSAAASTDVAGGWVWTIADVAARGRPEVEAGRRIRLADAVRAVSGEHLHGIVDEKPGRFIGLVEGEAERQGPEGAFVGTARRQLAGESRFVTFVGQDPGAARQRGARVAAKRRRRFAKRADRHAAA
jgi:hypothetical protein